MGKIRNVTLWLMAVVTLMGCAASRKTATGSHEERGDSTVAAVTDSVRKSDVKTDSTVHLTTDESHASGTIRTIHRKGDYERNATYEARLKHQEEIMTRMQHTIDSLVLSNKLNVGTHWAKKDSTNVVKEKNTVDIQSMPGWKRFTIVALIFAIIFCTWLYNKNKTL